ncbi:MAG TPA: hypothetical protein VGD80_42890 [Kofleriaceae bacterium]
MHRAPWIVLCFTACTAADPDGTTDGPGPCEEATAHSDLAWIQSHVFDVSCSSPSCHRGVATNAGLLDLGSGHARDQLVGVTSTSSTSWKRVVPGDPSRSFLLAAIGHIPGPRPMDGIMPLGGPMLCVEKREAIQRWIEAGAPP